MHSILGQFYRLHLGETLGPGLRRGDSYWIRSNLPMYGRNTSGTVMLPSSFW